MNENPPYIHSSIRSLARAMGKSESAVRKWKKHPTWPFSTGRNGPWDEREVRKWADMYLGKDPGEATKSGYGTPTAGKSPREQINELNIVQQEKLGKTVEQKLLLRQRRLREAGELVSWSDVQRRNAQQIMAARNALLDIPRSEAPGLVGLTSDEIEQRLTEVVELALEALANDTTGDDNG